MPTTITINGHSYSDDNNTVTGLGNGGHRVRLMPMLSDMVIVASQTAASAAAAAIPASGKQVSTTPAANEIPCVASDSSTAFPGDVKILKATTTSVGYSSTISGGSSAITMLSFGSTGVGVPSWINAGVLESRSAAGLILSSYGTAGTAGSGGYILFQVGNRVTVARFDGSGNFLPETDNTLTMGNGSKRWSTIYAGTGTINTSDGREKTEIAALTSDEIAASKELAKELGTFQFLSAVAAKGDQARHHVGMTVQRAIEILESHNLDPFRYGFICHDQWEDQFVNHPAIEAVEATEEEPAIEAKEAWIEQTQTAGDRYSFRTDELLLFIARGFDARLSALEAQ